MRKGNLIHHFRRIHPDQTHGHFFSFKVDLEGEEEDMEVSGDSESMSEFSRQFGDIELDDAALLPPSAMTPRGDYPPAAHQDYQPSSAQPIPSLYLSDYDQQPNSDHSSGGMDVDSSTGYPSPYVDPAFSPHYSVPPSTSGLQHQQHSSSPAYYETDYL